MTFGICPVLTRHSPVKDPHSPNDNPGLIPKPQQLVGKQLCGADARRRLVVG